MQPEVIGDAPADVMFIGEAPGAEEDRVGRPFVGRSGQLLRDVVKESGLAYYNHMYTNIVRCRPPDNRTPSAREVKYCLPNLLAEIEQYDPYLIILLGGSPLKAVLGESGITSWRGVLVDRGDRAYLPTFHPAYLLRNQSALAEWIGDFEKAHGFLSGTDEEVDVSAGYEMRVVANAEDAYAMADVIGPAGYCSWDTEVNGLKFGDELVCMSFAVSDGDTKVAWTVFPNVVPEVREVCEVLLASDDIKKVGHNIKFDNLVIRANWGFPVGGIVGDSMLLSYTIDPVPGRHGLKVLAGRHLGMYDYNRQFLNWQTEHPECSPANGGDLNKMPMKILAEYAQLDAIATLELHDRLYDELDEDQLIAYEDLIIAAAVALTDVEEAGAILDHEIIDDYIGIYRAKRREMLHAIRGDRKVRQYEQLREQFDKHYDGFNPGSSQQVSSVLHGAVLCPECGGYVGCTEDLKHNAMVMCPKKSCGAAFIAGESYHRFYGLKVLGRTKTGNPSVSWKIIKSYEQDVPFLPDHRMYSLMSKMLSTYLLPARDSWEDTDGRVRSSYNVQGTVTGRLSSSDPNLQNIPTPEKEPGTLLESHPIKNIFTHTWEGGCILAADYSGMELRTMASISGCEGMIDAFMRNIDVHSYVTELLMHVKQKDHTPDQWKSMRYRAKWVNWTLMYGGSWHTLHSLYDIPEQEAKQLIANYYGAFPEVLDYNKAVLDFARKNGYTQSKFGRRRYYPYINDNNDGMRRADERAAVNMPIQSAASDMLLCALIILTEVMRDNGFQSLMVNTVHDSIMFDVYPGELDDIAWTCKEVMENLPTVYGPQRFPRLDFSWFTVPLKVDLEAGSHYGMVKHYELEEV